jgi:hypothetical protein
MTDFFYALRIEWAQPKTQDNIGFSAFLSWAS